MSERQGVSRRFLIGLNLLQLDRLQHQIASAVDHDLAAAATRTVHRQFLDRLPGSARAAVAVRAGFADRAGSSPPESCPVQGSRRQSGSSPRGRRTDGRRPGPGRPRGRTGRISRLRPRPARSGLERSTSRARGFCCSGQKRVTCRRMSPCRLLLVYYTAHGWQWHVLV